MVVVSERPVLVQVLRAACADAPAVGGPNVSLVAVRHPSDALEQGSAEASYLVLDLAPGAAGQPPDFEEIARLLTIQAELNPACRIVAVTPPTPQPGDFHRFLVLGKLGVTHVVEGAKALDRGVWLDLLLQDPLVAWQHAVREDLTQAVVAVGEPGSVFPLLLRMLALAPQFGQLSALVPQLPLKAAEDVGARARALTRRLAQAGLAPPNYFLATFKLLTYCKVRDALPRATPGRLARLMGYTTAAAWREFVRSRFDRTMQQLDQVPYTAVLDLAADLCTTAYPDGVPSLRVLAAPYLVPDAAAPPGEAGVRALLAGLSNAAATVGGTVALLA